MIKNKKQLEEAAQAYKNLKSRQKEVDSQLNNLREDIMQYMNRRDLDNIKVGERMCAIYQSTTSRLDRKKLQDVLGGNLSPYEKVSSYCSLKVS